MIGSPIERRKVYAQIAERLLAQIGAGHLRPGDPLPTERQLTQSFRVGRSSVREALRILESQGLIKPVESGSFVVADASTPLHHSLDLLLALQGGTLRELFEVRKILEAESAALAATRRTESEMSAMADAIEEMEESLQAQERYIEADLRFHLTIAAATRNRMTRIWPEWKAILTTCSPPSPHLALTPYIWEVSVAELAFIGLGVMGGRIARRLLAAGHRVTGYNRTKAKARWLLEAGMSWADTPRQAAQAADVIFTMVTDTGALQAVTSGPDGLIAGLGGGKVYVDMSTVSSASSRALATAVAARGAAMLDAPVSGSVSTLEEGRLSIMVGGDRQTFERVKPILLAIGPTVTYMGENGSAVLMKIATNLNLATQILAFSESVLLAEKGGIPRELAVHVLLDSVIASPMLKYRGPFVLQMPKEAWFDVTLMQKDLGLALDLGRELAVPLPTTATANQWLTAARAMGLGDQDFAAVCEVLARLTGPRQRATGPAHGADGSETEAER